MLSVVLIRRRRQSDVDPLLEMALLVKELDGYPPRGPLDEASFIAPPQELAAWVAEIGSTVVGHVALHGTGANDAVRLAARHTGKSPEDLAMVARVLVSPTARRIGVGHALLDTAVDGAHERGEQPILDVATHLRGAISLYESCGWDRAGEVTIEVPNEPDLQCYVYVGPPPTDKSAVALTRR
jgi:GNAT superfamily N-acetyltransferase